MSASPGAMASSILNAPGRAQALRVFMLFGLVLILQIPVLFLGFLVSERRDRRDEASSEIASKWGQQQTFTGPALVVPWEERWTETDSKGAHIEHSETRRLVLVPESLHVQAQMRTETRRRGIYAVPVYRLETMLTGHFERPDFGKLGVDPARVDWSRAVLALGVSDSRAIQEQAVLDWAGRAIALEPGIGDLSELGGGIHADLGLGATPWKQVFHLPLELNGTKGLYFTPFGKQTVVELRGGWKTPSFQGSWLPTERAVAPEGFRATWRIPALGRNFPQAWTTAADLEKTISSSRFGLDLVSSIDAYRLCSRTVKYALLFFVLTFTAFWLLEVLGGRPLHPIQYVLVGAALCLFMLLELSFSEHLGFGGAYLIASAAVVGLIVHYAAGVLGSRSRAALVGGGLALLYVFHYVVLRNEDYALLLGSLLLFGALAAVMSLTRRIRWYGSSDPGQRAGG